MLKSAREPKRIHLICAARPNFMKIAPLYHALKEHAWIRPVIIHTGQHYDPLMSDAFFRDLGLPEPAVNLGVGSGTAAAQVGQTMLAYESYLATDRPELVVVVGDVNATMACTITAKKLGLPVAHLEAGLRSFDMRMPEEINRLVTDSLCDIFWTPSPDADENLCRVGVPPERIRRVGNIMIDSLESVRPQIARLPLHAGLQPRAYGVCTLHRPSNVDDPERAARVSRLLRAVAAKVPLFFPVHPRTEKALRKFNLWDELSQTPGLVLQGPQSYQHFLRAVLDARFLLTDSGGVQEESTYLGIPCITLRENTERPVTITQGTNVLANLDSAMGYIDEVLAGTFKKGSIPEYWDGRTSERIVQHLESWFE